jgi:hypothetical protein
VSVNAQRRAYGSVTKEGAAMKAAWEQYKRSFSRTQVVILIATIAIYMYLDHGVARTAVFFLMMELGAIAGAIWGVRLKRKVNREIC